MHSIYNILPKLYIAKCGAVMKGCKDEFVHIGEMVLVQPWVERSLIASLPKQLQFSERWDLK